jgi:hypothetical protein
MAKVPNHLHKYKKLDIGSNGKKYIVYRCMKPVCNHYIPIEFSEGKLCECNRCGEPMVITKATLVHSGGKPMAKPHCTNCIKPRKEKIDELTKIQEFLAGNKA